MKFKANIHLTYEDVSSMCKDLEYHVSKLKPSLIVGITRGGLLPALHLSHSLNIPMETIYWSTRDAQRQEYNTVVGQDLVKGHTVVFVDDINDSGVTFAQVSSAYSRRDADRSEQVKCVSLVEKVSSSFTTHASALRIDDPRWIVFPWETH